MAAKKSFKGAGADLFLSAEPVHMTVEHERRDLKINPVFQELIPPLSAEEFAQLEENLLENGIREAISVWNGVIIDGHNRYAIAEKHNLPFATVSYEFGGEGDVKLWIFKNQIGRRNLSAYERVRLALVLKPVIAEKAKERMAVKTSDSGYQNSGNLGSEDNGSDSGYQNSGNLGSEDNGSDSGYQNSGNLGSEDNGSDSGYQNSGNLGSPDNGSNSGYQNSGNLGSPDNGSNLGYQNSGNLGSEDNGSDSGYQNSGNLNRVVTDKIIADIAGVSHDTVARVERILGEGNPETLQKLKRGDISINGAYLDTMFQKRKKADSAADVFLPSLNALEGTFSAIYANPPWESLRIENVKKWSVPAAGNAVLLLWSADAVLDKALQLMSAWGFKYRTNMVWDKRQIGRGQHEILLIGTRGKFTPPSDDAGVGSVYAEEAGENDKHNKKPKWFYEQIERMFPGETYLELFAQNKYSERWTVCGCGIESEEVSAG